MTPVGVLVMAYGTPTGPDDVARYYTDIRRGSPPPAELLADLQARYQAIGGTFPLREITEAQCAELQRQLDALAGAGAFRVALGCRHAPPTVEDGVAALAAAGVRRAVGLVLAPHFSRLSVGAYAARAAAAGQRAGLRVDIVEDWHLLPAYLDFLAAAVRDALAGLPAGSTVAFTAHSLPVDALGADDPYPAQLAATAAAVAERVGLAGYRVAWQSAGRTAARWLGPDVLEVVAAEAAAGAPGLAVCACGFVADHLEVAYDLDIQAAGRAAEAGLAFARTASVNADPAVLAGLAAVVAARAAAAGG